MIPARSVDIDQMRESLVTKLAERGVTVLEIDLYDLAGELLRERGIWDRIIEMEASISKDELKELLQGVLDPETPLSSRHRATDGEGKVRCPLHFRDR